MLAVALPFGWLIPRGALPDWYFLFFIVFSSDVMKAGAVAACRLTGASQERRHSETIRRDARAILAPLLSEAPAFSIGKSHRPWARVDREGLEHRDWRGNPQRIAWQDVEMCVYAASYDVLGERASGSLVLVGREGKKLAQLAPSESQAAALLPATRFYLRGQGFGGFGGVSGEGVSDTVASA